LIASAIFASSIFLLAYTNVPYLIDLLLEKDTIEDAIPRIPLTTVDSAAVVIPKHIHQIYASFEIPERWREPRQQCLDLHPDYNYTLWTDTSALDFLQEHYSWFLPTYNAYPYPIQRADAIRYFILRHYGGTYLDLDVGCARSLKALGIYSSWVHRTDPTGISNDAMASAPQHPFWIRVTEELSSHARQWPLPYIAVMYGTGPLFLSVVWRRWVREGKNIDNGRISIMSSLEFNSGDERWFNTFGGSSWHAWDVRLLGWITRHWVGTVILLITSTSLAFWFTQRLLGWYRRTAKNEGGKFESWLVKES
jgi:inositol phosphorylceramide mannosyltransferase catalytic subunit